jgi:FkbM family methyltransferase
LAGVVRGFRSKYRVVLEAFVGRILDVVEPNRRIELVISIDSTEVRIALRSRYELLVFEEVFLHRDYDISYRTHSPKVLVDIGANVGLAALFFADRFPTATIHAVEPDPCTYQRLCEDTAAFPNIKTHCIAIAPESGSVRLHRDGHRSASSSLLERDGMSGEVEVMCKSLRDFVADIGTIDLVKFDIEGVEWEVFRAADAVTISNLPELVGEIHFDLIPVDDKTFYGIFSDLGFSIIREKIAPQRELAHIIAMR